MKHLLPFILALLSFCCSLEDCFAEQAPVRIGVIHSATGIAAEDGKTVLQALRLARRDVER